VCLSAFTGVLAVMFTAFFQVSKGGPFRDVNPFGLAPYDAVGSFAFQGALLLGILTYARVLRLHLPVHTRKFAAYSQQACSS